MIDYLVRIIVDHLLAIIIGVLASFVASFMFLLFLKRVKLKMVISDQIGKGKDSAGKQRYMIKVINKTPRSIIDIEASLSLVKPLRVPYGTVREFKNIQLKISRLMELSEFNLKDEWASYEHRFATYENIEDLWKEDDEFLHFRIHATDSYSGFSRVFTKDYHTKRKCIKEGHFEFGNSLEIK